MMRLLKRFFPEHTIASEPQPKSSHDPINDYYLTSAPTPQNAVDIFSGEWSSRFPPELPNVQGGSIELFDDPRIEWLSSELGNLKGLHILELGPLEGGHSYMLEKGGATSITAVEANTHAYLKCLIVKELLGLKQVQFLCGDFIEYLKSDNHLQYDIGLASGVLYHMVNPVELIALLAECCRSHLFLWTHYYDKAWATGLGLHDKFPSTQEVEFEGFKHTLVRQNYGEGHLAMPTFCGGSRPYSNWMLRDEITTCVQYFGFPHIKINFDEPGHPNGPAFALLASRA